MPAARSRKKTVILTNIDLTRMAGSSLAPGRMPEAAAAAAKSALRAAFSPRFSLAVAAAAAVAMWALCLIAPDTEAAGRAVAKTFIIASPWAAVWAVRAALMAEKGDVA